MRRVIINSISRFICGLLFQGIDINLQGLAGKPLAKANEIKEKMNPLLHQVRTRLYKLQETSVTSVSYSASIGISAFSQK